MIRSVFITAVICLFCVLASGCRGNPSRNTVHKEVDAGQLLAFFAQVSFVDEYDDEQTYGRVRKWQGPVNIGTYGEQAGVYTQDIHRYADLLSRLTNLSIRVNDQQDTPNFEIHFVPWDDIPELARPYSPNPEWLDIIIEDSACLFIYRRNDAYEIKYAHVFVSVDETRESIRSCLLEEMVQALGFPNDSNLIEPSVFNQWDRLQNLSTYDEILVQTLYDSAIYPGMPRNMAMAKAREIIDRLMNREVVGNDSGIEQR